MTFTPRRSARWRRVYTPEELQLLQRRRLIATALLESSAGAETESTELQLEVLR